MGNTPIDVWWLEVDLRAKQWLREHPRSNEFPESVVIAIAVAGGPEGSPQLSERDWDFIETQSEFVD